MNNQTNQINQKNRTDRINITEVLILPPIDLKIFLALYDGQDDVLISIPIWHLYDGMDEILLEATRIVEEKQ